MHISVMVKKQKAVERVKEQLEKLLVQQTDKVLLTYHSLTSYYQPVCPSVCLSDHVTDDVKCECVC